MIAFDNGGSDPTSIVGTFDISDKGKTIDCRDDGSKVKLFVVEIEVINLILTCI